MTQKQEGIFKLVARQFEALCRSAGVPGEDIARAMARAHFEARGWELGTDDLVRMRGEVLGEFKGASYDGRNLMIQFRPLPAVLAVHQIEVKINVGAP